MTLEEFGNHFSLARSPISKAPDEFSGHALWDCISNKPIRGFSNVRVNNIQHPAIRIWFRTLIGTFFGRSEVGTLNFTELSILGSFLNVQRANRFSLDLPYLVAKHMLDVAESRIKTIEIGGLITYLVNAMGFDSGDLTPVDANERWIDCEYLRASHHWLQRSRGVYRWRIAKDPINRFMILPSDRLPALNSLRAGEGDGLPSYLIPEDANEQNMEVEREQPPMRTQEEASSSNPPPSPHEIYMNQWNFMNQRFTHHAVNQNLESYWRYHNEVESGVARGPHPSYYRGGDTSGIFEEAGIDPNQWNQDYHRSYGGFGGQFLDEFGRLNVSGGANDGGANDDEDDED